MSLLIFSLATLAAPMLSAPTGNPPAASELPVIKRFALLDDRQGQRDPRSEQPAGGGRVPPGASDGAAHPMRGGRDGGRVAQPMAEDATIRIFPVKHTPVVTVADILNQQWAEIARPDVQNNRIIFVGPEHLVTKVTEFIAALDVPSQGVADEHKVELVLVQNRDPRDIVAQLSQTNFRQSVNFSADSARSMILLDGGREEIDQLKKLINGLDLPLVTCDVEFVFFAASVKRHGPQHESLETPKDLAPLAEELQRFGDVEYLARLSSVVTQDQTFQLAGGIGNQADIEIQGRMQVGSPFGNYTLNLGTDLRLASSEGKPGPRFSIKTTLTTPRDEFVVLGSAPNGWEPGESVIMAVRIPSAGKE